MIARQYSAKLKPVPIAYVKGGLRSVIDAGFSVGSGIANRAGAMYESFKVGLTTKLFMRGLGLAKSAEEGEQAKNKDNEDRTSQQNPGQETEPTLRSRSRSDPALTDKYRKQSAITSTTSPPGAEKLRMLNRTGRVDFCLQEGILENPYLSAFSAHLNYWQASILSDDKYIR